MKTNHSISTLCATILCGGLAAFTVQAASHDPAAHTGAATTKAAAPPQQSATAATAEKPVPQSRDEGSPWFGAIAENTKAPADSQRHGAPEVRITKVFHGSPASAAGLRAGDVLWKFNNEQLQSTAQFRQTLKQQTPGTTVALEIYRHGQREEMKVKLGTSHHAAAQPAATAAHPHAHA